MSANLQPFSSAGGFSSTANIVVGNVLVVQSISPAATASPAPSIRGFDTISGLEITTVNGRINSGTTTVVNDGINSIALAPGALMDVFGFPFSGAGIRGQLTISDITSTTEANGTWYYESTSTLAYQLYTDATYTTLVDASAWTPYTGGGLVAITKHSNAANVTIDSNGYFSKFDNTGNLTLSNNLNVVGGEIYLTGEGIIRSNYDTVSIQSYDVANSVGYGARIGTTGALYLEQGANPAWLTISPFNSNAEITGGSGTGGGAGKNITITAGAADLTDYYTTAGGNLNLQGGTGAGNDGGGGGPGGSVNITSGFSNDPAGRYGNVTVNTGISTTWNFDYTGNLSAPGDIITTGNINGNNITALTALTAQGQTQFNTSATANDTLGTSKTSGTITVGGANQTGKIQIGQSTASQILALGTGATAAGNSKDINIGTGGLANSTSTISIGPSAGTGYVSLGSATTLTIGNTSGTALYVLGTVTAGNVTVMNQTNFSKGSTAADYISVNKTSGTLDMGGLAQTGNISIGAATVVSSNVNIHTGELAAGNTKTVNIGTGGLAGSTANINIGPATANAIGTATFNAQTRVVIANTSGTALSVAGNITTQTVITNPVSLSNLTAVNGARAFILDGNLAAAGNFGVQVGGGGSNSVPVWSNGTNWYIG